MDTEYEGTYPRNFIYLSTFYNEFGVPQLGKHSETRDDDTDIPYLRADFIRAKLAEHLPAITAMSESYCEHYVKSCIEETARSCETCRILRALRFVEFIAQWEVAK